MPDRKHITIGMPVYNGENYIAIAIESLLAQTYLDYELIILDNCSTDNTLSICQEYATKDSRIQLTEQPKNVGATANFNALVDMARGEYFKWAAHDDILEPTYLERCVEILDRQPEIVWCHTDSDMVDSVGESWLQRMPKNDEEVMLLPDGSRCWKGLPRKDFQHQRPSKRFAGVLLGTRWCVDSYGLIRLHALKKTSLIHNIYGSEKVLMGELSLLGKTHQVPECLFKQRVHKEASGYKDSPDQQTEFATADKTKTPYSARLQLLIAHLSVVNTARISYYERICCYFVLLRYLLQIKKWKRVLSLALSRKGLGGGGRRIIETGARNA